MSSSESKDDGMTADQRVAWLRERGVLVETPEERRASKVAEALGEAENLPQESISFVQIPHDTSKPLAELSFSTPKDDSNNTGDRLAHHLRSTFSSNGKDVDLTLFQKQAAHHLGSVDAPGQVSEAALEQVVSEGNVETFNLVHATPSNNFTGINIYLDEVGMLKRLPLNTRASDYAARAGFNPPPQFYGDVFIGRTQSKPVLKNVSFQLGVDTAPDADWLQKATMENLEYQTSMNRISGRDEVQPALVGNDGVAKEEDGYSWTQTDEEVEVVVKVPKDTTSKDIHVKFLPKSVQVAVCKNKLLSLELFDRVDIDGSTWTLDRDSKKAESMLVITLEKSSASGWPRLAQ